MSDSSAAASDEVKALFRYPGDSFIVRAALEGHMGHVAVRGSSATASFSARLTLGVFTFLAGAADPALLSSAATPIVVALEPEWTALLAAQPPPARRPYIRCPMLATRASFDAVRLQRYVAACPDAYTVVAITEALAERTRAQEWSSDLCGNFHDAADFVTRGFGFVAVERDTGDIAAGAASFAVCDAGIEVEVDTAERHQRRGLALACSARLLLECLHRNLHPSWDAHVPHSVHLAEKLGYTRGVPYTAYIDELPSA
ncbi:GNAT acetyltransferase [Novymonas esmeraldas]|uniref:GNAT acetyltransferase n=1 Tax=Novymonas esmeraldas TaxID=1808958 RepID=A0AAW0ENK6_9TRYP